MYHCVFHCFSTCVKLMASCFISFFDLNTLAITEQYHKNVGKLLWLFSQPQKPQKFFPLNDLPCMVDWLAVILQQTNNTLIIVKIGYSMQL